MKGMMGIVERGSPIMLRRMRNLSGRLARTGRVLSATGLYFFLVAANSARCSASSAKGGA